MKNFKKILELIDLLNNKKFKRGILFLVILSLSIFSGYTSYTGATKYMDEETKKIIGFFVFAVQFSILYISKSLLSFKISTNKKFILLTPFLIASYLVSTSLSINFYYETYSSKEDSVESYKNSLNNVLTPFSTINLLTKNISNNANELAEHSNKMAKEEEKKGGTCLKYIGAGEGVFNKLRRDEKEVFEELKKFIDTENMKLVKLENKIRRRIEKISLPKKEDRIFFSNIYQEYLTIRDNPLFEDKLIKLNKHLNRNNLKVVFKDKKTGKENHIVSCPDSKIENQLEVIITSIKALKAQEIIKPKVFIVDDSMALVKKSIFALYSFDKKYLIPILAAVFIDLMIIFFTLLFTSAFYNKEISNILKNINVYPKKIFESNRHKNNFTLSGENVPLYYIIQILNENIKFIGKKKYVLLKKEEDEESYENEYLLNFLSDYHLIGHQQVVTDFLKKEFDLDSSKKYIFYRVYPHYLEIIEDLSSRIPQNNYYRGEIEDNKKEVYESSSKISEINKNSDSSNKYKDEDNNKINIFQVLLEKFKNTKSKMKNLKNKSNNESLIDTNIEEKNLENNKEEKQHDNKPFSFKFNEENDSKVDFTKKDKNQDNHSI